MSEFEDLLEVESEFYERMRNDLLLKYPNRVLLIHGERVEGDFASVDNAVTEGVRRFGKEPFLVRLSGDDEPFFTAPALTLGILRCR